MSEVKDLVMPVLQRIQDDVSDMKRTLADHGRKLDEHTEKLDEIEGIVTYALGMSTRNKEDIKTLQAEMKKIKERVTALEKGP